VFDQTRLDQFRDVTVPEVDRHGSDGLGREFDPARLAFQAGDAACQFDERERTPRLQHLED
jgi:hypothetical protein